MTALLMTAGGDLDFSSGTAVLLDDSDGLAQQVAQELNAKFSMFKGAWFADTRIGVPFVDFVLVKNPNLPLIDTIFRQVINGVQGVLLIISGDLNFNASARNLTATYQVQLTNGAVLVGGPGSPFIVQVAT